MTFNQVGRRVLGAASFSPDSYEDLRDDATATVPAIAVVVVATLLAAIGGFLWARIAASPPEIFDVDTSRYFVNSVLLGSIIQVGLWFGWVAMTWTWLHEIFQIRDVRFQTLLRPMGFAFAPMALQIFLVLPVMEFPVGLFAVGATVAGSVLAVRAASGAAPGQALLSTLAGFALFVIVLGILGNSDTDLAPGIFSLDPNAISVSLKLGR